MASYLTLAGKFQAFIAHVESVEDTEVVLRQLLSNKKIANSTHNMVAYRIVKENSYGEKSYIEFRDDDGEGMRAFFFFLSGIGGAGDKMLYVLQAKKAENLMVVVSRWYGMRLEFGCCSLTLCGWYPTWPDEVQTHHRPHNGYFS